MGFKVYGKTRKAILARARKIRHTKSVKIGKLHSHTKADGTKTKYALIIKKGRNYLKAHPGAMKHKGPRVRGMKVSLRQPGDRYCPTCGRLL
jgi:hypothetical protein